MAREYNPSNKDKPVEVQFSKHKKELLGRTFTFHTAECKEDGYQAVADSKAEAAKFFGQHMAREHPGRTVKKV